MNLRKKLLFGFFSVILLLIIITVVMNFQLNSINNSYSKTIEEKTEDVKLITYAIMENFKEQVALRSYLLTGDSKELENYHTAREGFYGNIETLNVNALPSHAGELIDNFVAGEESYNQVAQRLIEAKQQNNIEEYTRIMEEEGNEARENIESLAKGMLFQLQDDFIETSNQLTQQTDRTSITVLWISILAIIIGICVAIWISKNIANRVKMVSTSAEEIAKGNLAIEKLKVKSKDEIGLLAQSFNKMTENLRDVIQQVSQTSEQVAASSEELLASAEQTATATNQVATSITEAASSVEVQDKNTEETAQGVSEIATGITHIAETSSVVAESSVEVTKQASLGNENIQNVLKQMNTIYHANSETSSVIGNLEKRSSEIGKIIDVITDISDQTNLLALNAAIESARAGEHGKGFAVVADEVRKLAEQSRESANQISGIIQFIQTDTSKAAEMMNHGNNEVTNGLSIAEETGKTFNVILTSIENVTAQVQELSAVSEQMSASVQQVNASISEVSQLAKVTANNAVEIAAVTEEQLAATEEVSSAASSLANMAEELRAIVSKFKL